MTRRLRILSLKKFEIRYFRFVSLVSSRLINLAKFVANKEDQCDVSEPKVKFEKCDTTKFSLYI